MTRRSRFAASQGNFQLNVYKPVMLHNLLESVTLHERQSMLAFETHCAQGIEPNYRRASSTTSKAR